MASPQPQVFDHGLAVGVQILHVHIETGNLTSSILMVVQAVISLVHETLSYSMVGYMVASLQSGVSQV